MKRFLILFTMLLLGGCSWFKPHLQPIQQGNLIQDSKVNQLKIGMPAFRVKQIMGNPVLVNTFSNNQIDYVYTFKNRNDLKQKKVILTFRNNQLANIQKENINP